MGDRGVSHQAHYGLEMGAAQNNSYAIHNRKKIGDDEDVDGGDRTHHTGKTKLQQLIDEKLRQNPTNLQLSAQKLQNIEFIEKVPHYQFQNLLEIDISMNLLDNINILNELQGLEVIIAGNNYIRAIDLHLPKLRKLDIRNNFITTVPLLSQLPSLQDLILNANNVTELNLQCSKQNYAKMTKMVFRNNTIQFSKTELASFLKKLVQFKELQFLNLEHNPFMEDREMVKKIIKYFPKKLEMFNNERKLFYLSKEEAEDNEAQLSNDEETFDNFKQVEAAVEMMPTLENLLYNLEAANSRPSKALKFIQRLAIDADKVIQVQATYNYSTFVQAFTKAKDPRNIRENIETFMQHTQLLVDNNIESRTILLTMLSKLTAIKCHDFGIKCFYTLRDFLSGGQELEALVIEQLNHHVMKIISEANSKDIPIQILIGLKDLITSEESNYTSLVTRLFEKFFPKWLIEIKQEFQRSRGKSQEGDSHHADEIFALLTASLKDNEANVGKMYAQGLHNIVAEIFLSTSPQKIRYHHLLGAMNEIAKLHSHAASQIIEKNVHREVITEIRMTFYQYRLKKELIPPGEDYSIADVIKVYRVFSSQIDLIASLINAEKEQREEIVNDSFVVDLLQVLTHTSCDPVLLNSVCYLALQLLECDEVRENPHELAIIIDKMQSIENLLGYLGMDNFKELIRSYKKYNGMDPSGPVTKAECQMESFSNDPILNRLFISIVKLIEYFQKSLEYFERWDRKPGVDIGENNRRLMELCDNVSASLNEYDREEGLFNVLEIPNDDVRLAVVNCLYYVPIDEIDSLEIGLILDLLELQSQNVGVGKTELVLAVIFNILSNLTSDTQKKNVEVTILFRSKFSQKAISLALDILQSNQARMVDDLEEETEKYTLALSILNFFKFASLETKTKDQLKDKPEVLKQILYSEQKFTHSDEFLITPVEIETTQLGQSFDALKYTISHSQQQIEPYNWVSFRILHQMANLLQNQYPQGTYTPYLCTDYDSSILIKVYQKQLEQKKVYEEKFWVMRGGDVIEERSEDQKRTIKEHHKIFVKKGGFREVLHFLTAQRNSVENWLRMNSDPAISHAGEQEKHPIFGRGIKFQIRKKFLKARIAIENAKLMDHKNTLGSFEETKKPRGKSVAKAAAAEQKEKPEENNSKEEMQKILIEDDYGSGFIVKESDLYLARLDCPAMIKLLKQRQKVRKGVDNSELRCLSIATFLRCLYASIDSAPSGEYHELAIKNIKSSDKIFLSISQLCASTGWIKSNIGSKYLQVMRYVTRLKPNQRLEQEYSLYKYEILSIVVRRILSLLKGKIKNQNHSQEQLNLDDKNLLCHLSIVCNQLVNQSALFHWRKKKDHYGKPEEIEHYKLRLEITDTLIARLFGIDQVRILIDVVFLEIKNAAKRLNGSKREDRFKLKKDLGNNTLESLKKFLTEYLAYCETNKYHVLQYLTYTMANDASKKIRIPYLEEILEGTNQIQLSLAYMRKMIEKDNKNFEHWCNEDSDSDGMVKDPFYCRSLCYKKKLDMQLVLNQFQDKLTEQEEEQIERDQQENDVNCSLGERILFTQPMPVHVKYENEVNSDRYQVFSVIMTNLGVYIINDSVESCKTQNPSDRSKVQCPQRLDRFHYKEIKRVYSAKCARQRIVLCIQREVDHSKTQDCELYSKPNASKKAASFQRVKVDKTTDGGNTDVGLDLDLSKQAMAKRNKRRGKSQTEQIYVTLVTTSINDSMLINQFLDEAKIWVEQSDPEAEDVLNFYEDKLLEYSMVMQHIHDQVSGQNYLGQPLEQRFCPQCRKRRIEDKTQPSLCKCGPDNYIVYAYQIKDFGERTSSNYEPVPRGGPARLLNAIHQQLPRDHNPASNQMDTEFGVLMVSPQGIYFLTETPGCWQDMVFDDNSQQLHTDKTLFELFKEDMLCKSMLNRNEDSPLFIDLKKLKGMSKMQQKRVPSLEFRYTDRNSKDVQQVVFSMMSDFSIEETLFRVKDLKHRQSPDYDYQN